jgi:serine/threonine protein kinase
MRYDARGYNISASHGNGSPARTMDNRIGKYQIRRELGEGAASTVYLAYDEFYNAELALKVYHPDGQLGPGRGQFVSEAALAGKLLHPHIVTILDAAADPLTSYVAMEYVPGGNLHRYTVAKRLLPVQDVIQIAFKCCGALDYAYREGVVHRDIKPANILVAEGTDVKLGDFGAAFIAGVETTQRVRVGSPSYIAPEQIRDEPLTHQSDMFSLGVVLYELLCGVRPFRGANTMETLDQVLRLTPSPPSRLRSELPQQLDPIVLRLLQKAPAERYANWAELALDLARVGRLSRIEQAITDSEKYTALRTSRLLTALSDAEIWELVSAGHWRRLPGQTLLVREGDVGDSLFILAEGEAKVTIQGKLLDVLRAGECFGEMAYVRGEAATRGATVETTTDALAVALPRAAVDGLSVTCQLHLTRALLRAMADRLNFANERVARTNTPVTAG